VLGNLPMRLFLGTIAVLLLTAAAWPRPASGAAAVTGSWEGDSKCTIADSPCHDEHVLYQIAEDKKDPWQLNLDAYKVIEGAPEFMGTLTCHYQAKAGVLSCTSSSREKDDWEFHVMGETMSGRLLLDGGKTLYHRVALHRVEK